MKHLKLVLASSSKGRAQLLQGAGYTFDVVPSPVDENKVTLESAGSFEAFALQKAAVKAQGVVSLRPEALIVGCDTIIVCNGCLYEKPRTSVECTQFMHDFSGSTCMGITGVALRGPGISHDFISIGEVDFRSISESDIAEYVETPEPYDKAGGFATLGRAARWIRAVRGDFCAVIGLPVCAFAAALEELGVAV